GYYSQEQPAFAPEKRVIDIVQDIADSFTLPAGANTEHISATQLLTRFLFPVERQYTPVEKLSGGELRRLYLCTVLVSAPNFLVLDEPTNDLDILTLQALEEYLQDFSGCVLIVSHDRFFMDKVTEHLLCFEGEGKVRDFPGNYTLYRAWQAAQEEEQARLESSRSTPTTEPKRHSTPRPPKLTYAEKRELEGLEGRIAALEQEKASLETTLSSGTLEHTELLVTSQRIGQIVEELDELVLRQLELEEKAG
ncbi:ATP-binding cassette domain-containing protein, partial [uncultured Porphyromonas sp.]|uniref:ATP-binding cassette domain-containing protein n=1 Tax=uncultured Porphyromonas sp. TaxID=159274 RepID=UPI002613986B